MKLLRCSSFPAAVVLLLSILLSGCNWGTDPDGAELTLDFNPSPALIDGVGGAVDVDIMANNANGLITARITVHFEASLLSVEAITTNGDDFLFKGSGAEIDVLEVNYDNDIGTIIFGVGAVKSEFKGATGSGKLATITFKGLKEGSGFLNFIDYEQTDTFLATYSSGNSSGWDSATLSQQLGIIRVVEEPPPVSPTDPSDGSDPGSPDGF